VSFDPISCTGALISDSIAEKKAIAAPALVGQNRAPPGYYALGDRKQESIEKVTKTGRRATADAAAERHWHHDSESEAQADTTADSESESESAKLESSLLVFICTIAGPGTIRTHATDPTRARATLPARAATVTAAQASSAAAAAAAAAAGPVTVAGLPP
jgi:L-fucose isomerase-like protein